MSHPDLLGLTAARSRDEGQDRRDGAQLSHNRPPTGLTTHSPNWCDGTYQVLKTEEIGPGVVQVRVWVAGRKRRTIGQKGLPANADGWAVVFHPLAACIALDSAARAKAESFLATLSAEARAKYSAPEQLVALSFANYALDMIAFQFVTSSIADDGDHATLAIRVRANGRESETKIPMVRSADGWSKAVGEKQVDAIRHGLPVRERWRQHDAAVILAVKLEQAKKARDAGLLEARVPPIISTEIMARKKFISRSGRMIAELSFFKNFVFDRSVPLTWKIRRTLSCVRHAARSCSAKS